MGVSVYTKVGPYLQVKGKQKVSVQKIKRICPNHPKEETNHKFCPQCGTLVESVEYVEEKLLNAEQIYYVSDVYEDDKLWFPEYCDSILPVKNPPNNIKIDIHESQSVDLTNVAPIIDEQLTWFKDKFKVEIEFFQKTFGEENVKICWGIVTFYC